MTASYDICVAGGGPAGITVAVKLNRIGYSVLLIVADNKHHHPDLQSVSPGVLTLIKVIGLREEKIHTCLHQVQNMRKYWTGVEEEVLNPPGFLVHRHVFDHELLKEAQLTAVSVMPSTTLISGRFVNEKWELTLNNGKRVSAKFLVDATGKKSFLRGPKIRATTQMIAITGTWQKTSFPPLCTRLESASDHWFWGAKLSGNLFHATLFTKPFSVTGKSVLTEFYINAIRQTRLFRDCLHGSISDKLMSADVTPFYNQNPIGHNFIKVGEAALAIDPQSSQGVQSAMANSIQGAIAVNTMLNHPSRLNLVVDFYSSRVRESIYNHISVVSKSHMPDPVRIPNTDHWDMSALINVSDKMTLKKVACIKGDFITRKTAITHPGLPHPMLYWQGAEVGKVIEATKDIHTVSNLLESWVNFMRPADAFELFSVLMKAGVIQTHVPVIS